MGFGSSWLRFARRGSPARAGLQWGLLLGLGLLSGCTSSTPWVSSALTEERIASPNAGERRPALIVLHHTGEASFAAALATLTSPASAVSAHYLIGRDGRVAQLVDERRRAWHAGTSRWGPIDDLNSSSIGIELDNDGDEPFAAPQITALLALLADLVKRYQIDPRNIVGHADIAPRRKTDPSRWFPWATLAAQGFGLWCRAVPSDAPPSMDDASALRVIGYQVDDALGFAAARHAFRLHFEGLDDDRPFDAHEQSLLECLQRAQSAPAPLR